MVTTSATGESAGSAPALLDFRGVTVGESYLLYAGLQDVNLTLCAGELAVVLVDDAHAFVPLAPLAQGMILPEQGEVLFEGQRWTDRQFARHAAMRGRIGRVFAQWGWVSNLNVLENVTLARRHHTADAEPQIVAEADALARRFGLEAVPRQRPAFVRPEMLRISEWVRALLIRPRLLLLDRPLRDVSAEWLPELIGAVNEHRDAGGAALWITSQQAIFGHPQLRPTSRYRLERQHLLPHDALSAPAAANHLDEPPPPASDEEPSP
jgi:phospholipid/cholesterol/gamma-HCH transport system ATP-binding protein